MTKLWCIAIAMGGPEDGMVVVSTQMSGLQEMAVAQAVSDLYRQTGTKLPLMGINCRELTREYLVEALRLIDEDEQKRPGVVQLRSVGEDYLEKHYGMKPIPLSEGPGPQFAQWTDEMIANHFGQSKTKEEIDRLAGRKLNWDAIDEAARQSWRDEPA